MLNFQQKSCYFQKQLFGNQNVAANLIDIELPSVYHRFVEFFFMLSPISPASFIRYWLIQQHLSEKWHASNQMSFQMTSNSHLEGFMDVMWGRIQVVSDLGLTAWRFYPQCHGQSCQQKWPWLITWQLWREMVASAVFTSTGMSHLVLLGYSNNKWFILQQKDSFSSRKTFFFFQMHTVKKWNV